MTDDEAFEQAVRVALSEPLPTLPPEEQRIGSSVVQWFESEPGVAVILAFDGSVDDRALARTAVKYQLEGHGYKQAQFTIEGTEDPDFLEGEGLSKTAHWNDIMAKAKRLVQSGAVQILKNSANSIMAHVKGDHGEYDCEIAREDPNSRSITQWQCSCPWDQFAWQRTRKWKKYEGRVCSHTLAAFWASRSVPLDEEIHPSITNGPIGPDGTQRPVPGPATIPGAPTPAVNSPAMPDDGSTSPTPPVPAPGGPQTAPMTGPVTPFQAPPAGPADPGILPQFQGPPAPPPVSVPGGQVPTPENPVQYPAGPGGGTFSHVAAEQMDPYDREQYMHGQCAAFAAAHQEVYPHLRFGLHYEKLSPEERENIMVEDGHEDLDDVETHQVQHVFTHDDHFAYDATGKHPMPYRGWDHTAFNQDYDDVEDTGMLEPGYQPEADWVRKFAPVPHGVRTAADAFNKQPDGFANGNMVQLKNSDYGIAEGKSEAHGSGEYREVKQNSIGEVMGQDPITGLVEVIYPLHNSGPMEPYHVRMHHFPSEIIPRPDIARPGPFRRRR